MKNYICGYVATLVRKWEIHLQIRHLTKVSFCYLPHLSVLMTRGDISRFIHVPGGGEERLGSGFTSQIISPGIGLKFRGLVCKVGPITSKEWCTFVVRRVKYSSDNNNRILTHTPPTQNNVCFGRGIIITSKAFETLINQPVISVNGPCIHWGGVLQSVKSTTVISNDFWFGDRSSISTLSYVYLCKYDAVTYFGLGSTFNYQMDLRNYY